MPHDLVDAEADVEPAGGGARHAPIRCLWLTKGLGRGGVERLLTDMYPLMDPARYEVHVAYVLPWKDAHRLELEASGATVHCLGASNSFDPRWVGRLRRLMRENHFDVVHTHAPVPAVGVRLQKRVAGSPVVVHTEHNMWDRYRVPTRLANSWTYHRNDEAIAVSGTVAGTIQGPRFLGQPPVTVILHGTDLRRIVEFEPGRRRTTRRSLGLPVETPVVVSVGNFTAKKNQDLLLRAAARLDGVHLALVGSGPLEAHLQQLAEQLGISERVSFLGMRDDVLEILPAFDAFALSSRFEGFPIALVEAMATGLPCVATTVGGIPEVMVDDDNGLLVPSDDEDAFVDALGRVLDPAVGTRLGASGRSAAQALDLSEAVAAMCSRYELALAGRTRSLR